MDFCYSIYSNYSIIIKRKNLIESILSGVLFHGLYLGGVFYSISIGMPTSLAALIVTLQPILTNILSGPLLNEKVTLQQWVGVLLGFIGASLVLGIDVGSGIPLLGLIATLIALLSITFSTIWQKKLSNNLPLSVSNFYQALGGCLFHVIDNYFFYRALHLFYKNIYNSNESSNFSCFFWCIYNTDVFNKKKFS